MNEEFGILLTLLNGFGERERAKHSPANPKSLAELENISGEYRTTAKGDDVLQYDSYEDPERQGRRVMVLFTDENLKLEAFV